MKDKLRELAERWKAYARTGCSGDLGEGRRAEASKCANELLSTLDAEGDGGAVGEDAVAEVYEYGRDRNEPVPRLIKGIRFTGTPLPVGTKLYTHPARSGVVSDEDVEEACRKYYNCGHPVYPPVFEGMRAALEHFARRTP